MAFDKIKNESKNALLVLDMMAYMDNRFINRKTFLYFNDIDGDFELNEILELLCQYSLVMHRNHGFLEIHGLVQKVIQYDIENNRFVEGLNPQESLSNILTSISRTADFDDVRYKDDENLWFVHIVKLMKNSAQFELDPVLLVNVAKRRHDRKNLYYLCQICLPFILEEYSHTKDIVHFLNFLDIHREFLTFALNNNSFKVEEMIKFEKDFTKELEIEHRSAFLWKIQLARFFQRNNQFESERIIILKIFKQLDNKEGFDDVKLEFCISNDINGEKFLLKQINESNLEKESDKLKYFSIRFFQFLRKRDFAESEKWLNEFEEGCIKYDFSYYEHKIVFHKVWFLYWKLKFNEALDLLEELDEVFKQIYSEFYVLKSLLLLKLGKYDEAEYVYDGHFHFDDIHDNVCHSFIKAVSYTHLTLPTIYSV